MNDEKIKQIRTGAEVYQHIKELFGLPDNVTKCSIHLNFQEAATVDVTYYPKMALDEPIEQCFTIEPLTAEEGKA